MSNFKSFIKCDDFTEFELLDQSQFTKIVLSQKYFSPSQKYVFKIFKFDCHSSKEQQVILDTFTQISKKKSQYLRSYNYLSFYFKSKPQPAFSMKYTPSKTLEQVLKTPDFLTKFKIENIMQCLFAVVEGMSYLHNNLIIHGNLCPSNIIIDEANQFYLCDFGLYPIKELYIKEEYLFNKDYKDPYMTNNCPSFSSDVYSFGVLMCDICVTFLKASKKMKHEETLESFLNSKDQNKFDAFPSFCVKLISSCMNSFTCERPSFNQIIKVFKQENQQIFGFEVKQLYKEFLNSNYLLNLAAINDINALFKVGKMYEKGKVFEKDLTKALEYYEKASDLNNSDAQNNLGVLLQEKEGRNKSDLIKGAKYLRLSAEKGNIYGLGNYGIALLNGDGVEKNILKAEQYLQKSADLGYSYAQLYYGKFLLDNVPTILAVNKGLNYIKKAMNQNNPNAYCLFGSLLQEGKFIEKNVDLAFEKYKIAAEMGNTEAMIKYADENLKNSHRNEKIALKYYQIAYDNGVTSVNNKINELKEKLEEPKNSIKQPKKINETSRNTLQKKNIQSSSKHQSVDSLNKRASIASIVDSTLSQDRHKKHVINASISLNENDFQNEEDKNAIQKKSSINKRKLGKYSMINEEIYNDIKKKLKNNIPISLLNKITLISLGEIVYDRENYHTRSSIFPVGYQIEKEYFSKLDRSNVTIFRFTVLDGGDSPIFQMEYLDGSKKIYKEDSLEILFSKMGILQHTKLRQLSYLYFCGLNDGVITYLIERLPNADRCINYEFKTLYPNCESDSSDLNKSKNNDKIEENEGGNKTEEQENNNKNKVDEVNVNDDVDLDQPLENIIEQGDLFYEKNNFVNALKCYNEAVNRGRKDLLIKCAESSQTFDKKLEYLEESIKEKIPRSFTKWRLAIMRRVYLTKNKEDFHNFARLFESHQDFSDAAILYNKNKEIINSQICYEKAKTEIDSIQDGYQQYDFALFLIKKKDNELAQIMLKKAVENKIPKAESKLEKLSQPSQPKALNEVQSLLQKGIDYYKGTNEIKKNSSKAMECFERASKLGCIKADFYIGMHNVNEKGLKYLRKAVESGDPDAQKHYAHYLKNGILMQKDKEKAMYYYKLAADQGQSEAAFEFGKEKYENGSSHEEKDEGIKYLKKSAESLFPDAIYIYSKICKETNPEDSKKFLEFSIEKGSQLALLEQEINSE